MLLAGCQEEKKSESRTIIIKVSKAHLQMSCECAFFYEKVVRCDRRVTICCYINIKDEKEEQR